MTGSKIILRGGSDPALPPLSLVLGGARSGKSSFAERLAAVAGGAGFYIATAEPGDDEMRARIARHRADRGADQAGPVWHTVEAPYDLPEALSEAAPPARVVLIDCLTLWLSNHLLAGGDIALETSRLSSALAACGLPVIAVSNEVGWGIVPENPLGRRFRDEQGRLNQIMAGEADLVVGIMAGLPMVLKGSLPDGLSQGPGPTDP